MDLASASDRPTSTLEPEPVSAPTPPAGRNLLDYQPVARLLRSRWYPGIFQWAAIAVFAVVVYQLLLGPDSAHDNLGTALVWVLWWPLIPIIFVVLGRFWCAVCPFGKLSDLVQKLVGAQRPVPRFLKKYGIWIIDAQFIAITWADHVWGIVESPWGTGILLLLLITAVVTSGAFFQRRTFCRYLCFFGGMAGNYARTGSLALRADTDICGTCTSKAVCFNGGDKAPACPLFEFPRTMDSSANCNLCANCFKNCPNDAITLTPRKPSSELWFIRKPKVEESALAMAIMGIVLIQNITMLQWWQTVLDWIERTTGITSYPVIFTIAFVLALAAPLAAIWAASAVAARRNVENTVKNFARFGYALIPLDVAGHIAHNLFHLLAEGGSVYYTALAMFGYDTGGTSTALVGTTTIQILQYLVLAAGIAGSAYTAYRIARTRYVRIPVRRATLTPYLVVIGLFAAANIALFLLPMAHRM
ncbi:ferredoxin [Actinoplanes capillaceus]|uniref:Ferredoxin n=3 Tax=Actinoplanes campanulatus TaxID=113559 RepID=A0ABQ3WUV7_9ACTN|nr:4Fe-4S binding protein [Actinoplanes capillaceus]GID49920.1 ferredoxin [Actinoplanes capillaceus]